MSLAPSNEGLIDLKIGIPRDKIGYPLALGGGGRGEAGGRPFLVSPPFLLELSGRSWRGQTGERGEGAKEGGLCHTWAPNFLPPKNEVPLKMAVWEGILFLHPGKG